MTPSTNRRFPRLSRGRDKRIASRMGVAITAEVREPGLGKIDVQVLDLSISGFQMRCLTRLTGEKDIFMRLPTFSAIESRIAWVNGEMYGCEFLQALHPAVFQHIVQRYPSLREQAG